MLSVSALRAKYARVIRVVGATARLRHGAQLQGLTLADVAQEIVNYREFCQICREDMRDAWINDSEHRLPRTTGNRVDTWERLYGHWYAKRSTGNEPPAIRVKAQDRQGTYTVEAAEERRSEDRLWNDIMRKTRALHIPQHLTDEFQRATAHYYREWQAAQAAAAAQSKAAAQIADASQTNSPAEQATSEDLPQRTPQVMHQATPKAAAQPTTPATPRSKKTPASSPPLQAQDRAKVDTQ